MLLITNVVSSLANEPRSGGGARSVNPYWLGTSILGDCPDRSA
jgi:hypothetical protein